MLLKTDLYNIVNYQQRRFFEQEERESRELINQITNNNSQLLVLNGIKRTGKSTFLKQLFKEHYQDVFYINFEYPGLYDFDKNDFFKLDEIIGATGNKVLFFDEITQLNDWQSYVNQKLEEGFRVVLTASDTDILNNKSGQQLTGKYVNKQVLPFSYNEFCGYKQLKKDRESLLQYMKQGGFPANLKAHDDEYLMQLFDDLVVREIGLRFGVRDLRSFKKLAMYLLQHVGALVTGNQLKGILGIKTTTTVIDYMSYFEAGFLMHYLPKFSYSARKQQVNPRKAYVVDTGLISANTFDFESKIEAMLENLVYLKLKKEHSELYYFQEQNHCDFIAFGLDKALHAVQVCANLQQDNLEKELNGLFEAMEYFEFTEGTLITLDQSDRFERNGMKVDVIPFHKL